jgi:hypothetical protein
MKNSKLSGSWQVQVARHCAKPPPRCRQVFLESYPVKNQTIKENIPEKMIFLRHNSKTKKYGN